MLCVECLLVLQNFDVLLLSDFLVHQLSILLFVVKLPFHLNILDLPLLLNSLNLKRS